MLPSFQSVRFLAVVSAVMIFAGCMTPAINDPARAGPFYQPKNIARDLTLGGIRRVVLLPVWGGEAAANEDAADLDPVFRKALQDENRFEVVNLSREECRRHFGATAVSSAAALPHDFLATLKRLYAADAVMFVDITVYRAYQPLAIGIRSKLATINGARLVWTFDNVFSATDARVAAGARHFYLDSGSQDVPGDLTPAVLQSPGRFAAYAAHTTFATLPPVTLGNLTETSSVRH